MKERSKGVSNDDAEQNQSSKKVSAPHLTDITRKKNPDLDYDIDKILPPQSSKLWSPQYLMVHTFAAISCTWVIYESIRHSSGFSLQGVLIFSEYGRNGEKRAYRVGKGWLFGQYQVLSTFSDS
jgi:hypothetical protein